MATPLDTSILSLLPTPRAAEPWLSTSQVVQRLVASGHVVNYDKTVIRRLQALEAEHLVRGERRGRMMVWQRREGANGLAKGAMSFEEALALQILRQFATHQLPEQVCGYLKGLFDMAQARLAASGSQAERHYAKWGGKVALVGGQFQLLRPAIRDSVFRKVSDALFMERLLRIRYLRPHKDEQPWRYTLMPLGLVETAGGLLYLIARAKPGRGDFYPDPVRYRLDRMTDAQVLDEGYTYPEDFSLDAYIRETRAMEFFEGEKTRVTLNVAPKLGRLLQETPLSGDQTVTLRADEWFTVQATVVSSLRFREWLLAQGPQIEVAAPEALRADIKASLKQTQRLYR